MLQIVIVHENNTHKISEIKDLDTMTSLQVFDENKKCIDLSSLSGHEGETILVTHFIKSEGCTRLDYEDEKTLIQVGEDSSGLAYMQYN